MAFSADDRVKEGFEHHQAGRLDAAEAAYRTALEADPDHGHAHNFLGTLLAQKNAPEEAEGHLRRALAAMPDDADILYNLGLVLGRLGRFEEEVQANSKAVIIRPDYAPAWGNLGAAHNRDGRYAEAEEALKKALALQPGNPMHHNNLGITYQKTSRASEAIEAFRKATELHPKYFAALKNLGAVFMDQKQNDQAVAAFRKALEINPDDRECKSAISEALSRTVPSWHFPMLADAERNSAYRRAIDKAVDRSSRVLDIGAGSGLLSLCAARAGAATVTACEVMAPVAEAARKITMDNGYEDRITVVNKRSTEIAVGEDMAEPATVLISEILDDAVIGEGLLPTYRHALKCLCVPGVKLIPRAATVKGLLIEAPHLRKVNPLREIEGFDLSAFNRFRNPMMAHYLHLSDEKHSLLSGEFDVFFFDFSDPPPDRKVTLEIPVTASGALQAVAFWFTLDLDGEIALSTGPESSIRHWKQGLFFLPEDRAVQAGEVVKLTAGHNDHYIHFE